VAAALDSMKEAGAVSQWRSYSTVSRRSVSWCNEYIHCTALYCTCILQDILVCMSIPVSSICTSVHMHYSVYRTFLYTYILPRSVLCCNGTEVLFCSVLYCTVLYCCPLVPVCPADVGGGADADGDQERPGKYSTVLDYTVLYLYCTVLVGSDTCPLLQTSVGELTQMGIKNADKLAVGSTRNEVRGAACLCFGSCCCNLATFGLCC